MNPRWSETLGDPSAALFTLGFVAELLGIDVQMLRRHDAEGFASSTRTPGQQRRYSRDDIARIARAVLLAEQAISLVGVRRIMELEDRLVGR